MNPHGRRTPNSTLQLCNTKEEREEKIFFRTPCFSVLAFLAFVDLRGTSNFALDSLPLSDMLTSGPQDSTAASY
jgi:hypothetical protein